MGWDTLSYVLWQGAGSHFSPCQASCLPQPHNTRTSLGGCPGPVPVRSQSQSTRGKGEIILFRRGSLSAYTLAYKACICLHPTSYLSNCSELSNCKITVRFSKALLCSFYGWSPVQGARTAVPTSAPGSQVLSINVRVPNTQPEHPARDYHVQGEVLALRCPKCFLLQIRSVQVMKPLGGIVRRQCRQQLGQQGAL